MYKGPAAHPRTHPRHNTSHVKVLQTDAQTQFALLYPLGISTYLFDTYP